MPTLNTRLTTWNFRRAASLLALVGVVVSSLGIGFVPASKQDSSQAFPCQGGSCGCQSATQCWQSCCCTSVAERIAWAKENDVTPPSFLRDLLAAANDSLLAVESMDCCSHLAVEDGTAASCTESDDLELSVGFVLLSDLSRCRGLAKYLAIFGAAICEPLADLPRSALKPIAWLCSFDELFESPSPSPPTPPPRLSA